MSIRWMRAETAIRRGALLGVVALWGGCGSSENGAVLPDGIGSGGAQTAGPGGGASSTVPSADGGSACAPGQSPCGDACVVLDTDAAHCGACANACAPGMTCELGQCLCSDGLAACPTGCVDLQTDQLNCGSCGAACQVGQSCQAGACQCQSGLTNCDGACVDTNSDGAHCGACGNACTAGLVCSSGQCQAGCSEPGQVQCANSCVDTSTSVLHCGGCDHPCAAGQSCTGGSCSCSGGQLECEGRCVSPATDPSHCGGCNIVCATGQSCQDGVCSCPSGQTLCGGSCVDTNADPGHCGACGVVCAQGRVCTAGSCACPAGQQLCGADCVDTQTSTENCGSCGVRCAAGQSCVAGICSGGGTGGTAGTGGRPATGGTGTGGRPATGGAGTGGRPATGGAGTGGDAATGGAATGGATGSGQVFSQCRFHFGTIDSQARGNAAMIAELDFFTPGWMGVSDTFDQGYVCDEANGEFANQVPVVVAYVAAFYAKVHAGLNDCNVGDPDLCTAGAQYIQQNLSAILDVYRSYARGYADCYGTSRPIIFEMEPDFYQYTYDSQTQPMSLSQAGQIMGQFVAAIRESLPNAIFSMDISPWVAPDNGGDNGQEWYSNFDMSAFTFVNTSGGGTDAASTRIRASNNMTWAGVSQVTGKPILADTGYGVNGSSTGHDDAWDSPTNINARIADGVVSIAQYSPNSNWGSTISQIRGQLDAPRFCP